MKPGRAGPSPRSTPIPWLSRALRGRPPDYDFLMKKSTISDEELSISTLKYSIRLVR